MQKYYYMRLKEGFFDSESIVLLEAMQDGYIYSNILLKLYLKSLKNEGKLIFNNCIPYNAQMIATLTRHNVGVVEKSLTIFKQLGLIEILDNGAIYMLDIQNYIGQSSTEAERKKDYRKRISIEKQRLLGFDDKSRDICPTEIEIEKELELDKDIDIETEKKTKKGRLADLYSDYPDELKQAIKDFIEMRKLIKKPLTDRALKNMLAKLDRLSTDESEQIAILEQSINHSWADIYALKVDKPKGKSIDDKFREIDSW